MTQKRVAVILGGNSGEHEVSVVSARNILAALDPARWVATPFGITREGNWLTPEETRSQLAAGARTLTGGQPLLLARDAMRELATAEVVFPLVHGTNGEDGTLQGFFEMAGLPYAGCGVAASAIGMDKALMKALFREAGIPVAAYTVVRSWELPDHRDHLRQLIDREIGYPCFVKPANGGSSVGVSKVHSSEDLQAAYAAAFAYDDKALIEQAVIGQEVECSVLGNEHPEVSGVGEIAPDREFYDYDSKYDAGSTSALYIPARITSEVAEEVRELALRMYRVMGCEGYARIDFFVRDNKEVVANEINTIPGFTNISMYPKLWEAAGISYSDLLSRILDLALARHARRGER